MTKIERVENYLFEFFENDIYEFEMFYRTTDEQRNEGIFRLNNGNEILIFLSNVHSNISQYLRSEKLIPHRFTTPNDLLAFLQNFKNYIIKKKVFC